MTSSSDRQESLEREKQNRFLISVHWKNGNRKESLSRQQEDGCSKAVRNKLSDKSTPVRKDRVEEAKKKRENGDYDIQEVYRKIAEKLIDSFGI
jgi:anti-sigma28 factor (negative regulator of flagellin synthesis)